MLDQPKIVPSVNNESKLYTVDLHAAYWWAIRMALDSMLIHMDSDMQTSVDLDVESWDCCNLPGWIKSG